VAVVIPTWNGRRHLEGCLPALFSQTWQDFQAVVVDNGSTDDTLPWLAAAHPAVHAVALGRNSGFARACNEGIRATTAEYVVTLNNDTVPEPEFLAELVSAAEQVPDAGMFAATLWLAGEPRVVDAAGVQVNRLGVAWNALEGRPVSGLPPAPRPVLGPCAGAALYRRSMLDDVGLFDEGYFAYLEDVELAWRAQWAGWHCLWVPGATTWHAHSATGGRDLPLKFWLLGRNRLWTILRHYPRPYLWHHLPLIVANELLTGLLAAIALRHPAPIQGRLRALRRTRPPCRAPRRISPAEAFRLLEPLPSPARQWARYVGALGRGRGPRAAGVTTSKGQTPQTRRK
jgi:GT2 family glycosyltransferase